MSRLSLRTRLTLAFGIAMAIVFVGIGLFVERRVEDSLRAGVELGLRARAVDVASLAAQADNGLSSASGAVAAPGDSFGQLIDARGRVYDATPGLRGRPLLSAAQLRRARRGAYFLQLRHPAGGPAEVFVAAIHAQDQPLVLLVGTSLRQEQSALNSLRTGLLIGSPVALVLACLGGYLLAGAALRPVERMRARAAGLSGAGQEARLPVPRGNDEIARLGRTLNEMLARLEQAREREHQFVADASHELRTPLTLLKTELELALDEPRTAEELETAVRSASEETDRLVQLAEDLLLLAQSDRGMLPVRLVEVEAAELAERVVARSTRRAHTVGRAIVADVPPELTILADPFRIEQALANLIDNSLRHGAGTVTVQVRTFQNAVELHVRDEGAGIPPGFRRVAFERFTHADDRAHARGAGLGLAIVASIARAHHGQALIGERADVYLRLPMLTGGASAEPTGVRSEALNQPSSAHHSAR